jgi:cbb3-type cytochrome oxidase subunit 3
MESLTKIELLTSTTEASATTELRSTTEPPTTTIPEGSILTTSTINNHMNEPTTTTELLGNDIEHTTSSGQVISIEVLLDKENDASIVIVDSKLAIYLSASTLALLFVLAIIVIAMFVLVVVLLYTRKRKAKESESANIELTGMREIMIEAAKPKHASNIYTSPTHNHHSSEEKLDLM